jgi:hypothetical protein
MKTRLLFSVMLVIIYTSASAQAPILTASNIGPVPGDVFVKLNADTTGVMNGAPGASQTWDYSSLVMTGTQTTFNYVALAGTPNAASFPTATVVYSNGNTYSYQKVSPTDFSILGLGTASYTMVYTDPEILCTFPFTYLGSITDSLKGSYTSGSLTFNRKGVRITTADGWGTLKLPSGTYPNMLRVKVIQDYTDVTNLGGTTGVYNITYRWYDGVHKDPALDILNSSNITGTGTLKNKIVIVSSAFAGIHEAETTQNSISFEPNPVIDHITLTMIGEASALVQICNLNGQVVATDTYYGNNARIDVSSLPAGIYFIKAVTVEGSCIKKFVKL